MRPTTFGRMAVRDATFVPELRRGRRARPAMERQVHLYLDRVERDAESRRWRRR